MDIKNTIEYIMRGQSLSEAESQSVMDAIMSGEVNECQLAAFLTALRIKGESVAEVTGFARAMRAKGIAVETNLPVMDIVGTGGDEAKTFNISTTSCFVLGAMGIPMGKHGGRSVSSRSGAADVLEALGARIDLGKNAAEKVLKDAGMCFFFAPVYHASMKYAAPVRKALSMRSVFNILGPLASPVRAQYEVMGVYSKDLVEPMAEVLVNLGLKRGAVIHGDDGLDEITLTTTSTICEINEDGSMRTYTFDPQKYGFTYCTKEDLQGGEATDNKVITEGILKGEKGPKRDVVVLNSAVAYASYYPKITLEQAIQEVETMLDSGEAYNFMKRYVEVTQAV